MTYLTHTKKSLFFLFSLTSVFHVDLVLAEKTNTPPQTIETSPLNSVTIEPWWTGQFHVGSSITLLDHHSCPTELECIVGNGLLLGGIFEYKSASGLSLALGYDLTLLNGNSVYEVTIIQLAKAGVRYTFLPNNSFRPKVGLDGGFLLLGDIVGVDTFGGSMDVSLGAEWEINTKMALAPALFGRFVTLNKFQTASDNETRANTFGVDILLGIQLGLLFLSI